MLFNSSLSLDKANQLIQALQLSEGDRVIDTGFGFYLFQNS